VATRHPTRQRVVVIGGGFGGLEAVKALRDLPVDVTLIDRNNYHLFQPLTYQVSTAALSPDEIAEPLRTIFRRDGNVRVLMGEVETLDRGRRGGLTAGARPRRRWRSATWRASAIKRCRASRRWRGSRGGTPAA
jgi:NADPH-dependent 2,4-dienoyl-CoA reductase/sulfur reductase-like enzyme